MLINHDKNNSSNPCMMTTKDDFSGNSLGQCKNFLLSQDLKVSISLQVVGTNGWKGTHVNVFTDLDFYYHCPVDQWKSRYYDNKLDCVVKKGNNFTQY